MAVSKVRHVRVPDEVWDKAVAKAEQAGTTISQKINHALRVYVAEVEGGGEKEG